MAIETNNVAALRAALERLDELQEAVDDIVFYDEPYRIRLQEHINGIEASLRKKLHSAEWTLQVSGILTAC